MTITIKSLLLLIAFTLPNLAFATTEQTRVWVQFAPQQAEQALDALQRAGANLHHRFPELDAVAVSLPSKAIDALRHNPGIELIEDDVKRYPFGQTTPYGIDAVQARDIWDTDRDGVTDTGAANGSGVLICVIDSGLQTSHSDIAGVNIIGGQPSGWNNDSCGHGTHVAGSITALNNHIGVVGVSPGTTSLYAVKVFDGSDCGWTYSSDLVAAANVCADNNADIINMSLGGGRRSRSEDKAFKNLDSAGILLVAAAGNDGNTTKSYPASYNAVISVAAVDDNNSVADFSQQNSAVELAAPGVDVLSTVPWFAENSLTVNGLTYNGAQIEFAALGSPSGPVVDGGWCDTPSDWTGQMVMCERGNISFFDKVANVQANGGVAAVIYNNEAGGFKGTLGAGNTATIAAISLSQEAGQSILANALGAPASLVSSFDADGSGYETWSGTSMATPHVSAVAALVWSASPDSSNSDIRTALAQSALDLGTAGRDAAYGHGLVQAYDAWQLLGGGGGSSNQAPVALFTTSCTTLDCTFDGSASSDADDGIESYAWSFGDGASATSPTAIHSYSVNGTYSVSLTVTDYAGVSATHSQSVTVNDGSADTSPPLISGVSTQPGQGNSFVVAWSTDEAANSVVSFEGFTPTVDETLVTNHSMGFRGRKGVLYIYTVSSTDAAGNTATSDAYSYQN